MNDNPGKDLPVMWGIRVNGLISSAEFHQSFAEERIKNSAAFYGDDTMYELAPLYDRPAAFIEQDARRLDWMQQNVSAIRDIGWINGSLRDAIDRAMLAESAKK